MKRPERRPMLKRILSVIFSRLVLTALLLLAQVLWLFAVFSYLSEYSGWLNAAGLTLSVLMCLALIRKDSTVPEFKISWLILFMLMPVQGGMLYLLWGDKRPVLGMRRRLERSAAALAPLRDDDTAALAALARRDERAAATAGYLSRCRCPVYENTDATYYPVGEAMFADLLPALESAKKCIFVEFFIIGEGKMWGAVHEILRRKAADGLDVRVIYDDAGCMALLPHNYDKILEAEGIRAYAFNPCVPLINLVMNNRDHRKIVVIDDEIAFTGGVNLADEYINETVRFGHWKDTAVRLRGPAARSFVLMFLELWQSHHPNEPVVPARDLPPAAPHPTDGLVQPFTDSPVARENVAKNMYLDLISQAERTLDICTPYLILDNASLTALCLAAKRGVRVRVFTPGIPDKKLIYQLTRSYFPALLRAGVEIYSYTPGFLHAKTWLFDDRMAVVGTVNLDYRSFYLHFECGALLYGGAALRDIRADFDAMCAAGAPVQYEDCRTGFVGTFVSAVLRMVAPLC